MGDILIIGGGFAGLRAASILSKKRSKLNGRRILLVDVKKTFDFLPVLPDIISSRIDKQHAVCDLPDYLEKLGVNFQQDEVVKIDTQANEVLLKSGNVLQYEFLIISCGSVTNFYGSDDAQRRALKFDNVEDSVILVNIIKTYPGKKILIVGAGSTGIEVASHLAILFRRKKIKKYSINIVEKEEDILGPMPEWTKNYCRLNLCGLRVNTYTSCFLKEVTDRSVLLSNGMKFDDYLMIWTAGVATPSFVQDLKFEKDVKGRLKVSENMMFSNRCFAVGDAASFAYKGMPLRMAVQFSLAQASVAAKNILRLIAGKDKLVRYKPMDLGWLIPLANKKACGKVLFFRVWGIVGWFFHYTMCIYRSSSLRNKLGIFCDSFK